MLIERVKTLLSVLVICLALLSTVGFISFPLEAGAVLISLAVVIFSWQLIRYPEIILPKSVVIVWIFGLYTMLIKPFSYRVPSNDYTVFIIFLLSLYILIIYASLRKDIAPRIWENSLIIIALVISLFELREIIIYYNQYLSTINQITVVRNLVSTFRVSGFLFINPNVLAGFINLVWPIIVVRIVKTPTKVEKGLWFLAFFFISLVFLFTISRGGTIGAIFGGVVLVFRYCQTSFDRRAMLPLLRYFLNWKLALWVIFCLALGAGVFFGSIQSGQTSLHAFQADQWITVFDGLSSGRGYIWKVSWQAFLENPFWGHGNGSFVVAYAQKAKIPPGFLATSAHNIWLNIMVEYGIIGILGFFMINLWFVTEVTRYLYRQRSSLIQYSDAYLASLLAFVVQHFFDTLLWVPNYLAAFLIVSVLLLKYTFQAKEWIVSRKVYFAIGILCFVMVFILYFSMVSKVAPANQYNYLASTFNEEDRASSLCNLADQYIDNAMYHFQCSVSLVQQLLSSAKANSAGMIMHQAITYQRKGLSFDPHWPIQRANLAVLNWLNGEKSLAVEQMKQVTRQAPYNSLLWLNYGWMAEQVGDQHEALEAYERALRSSPLLLDSDFKRLSSLFSLVSGRLEMWLVSEAQWDSWYAGEILDKDYLRGTIYLAIGEYERALSSFRDSADRFPPSPDYYVSLAYAWYKSGQISKAFQIAYDLALLHSNQLVLIKDPTLLSLVGLILQENGQPDLAYQCFLDAYLLQTQSDNRTYYSSVYRQPILLSDISPLLIHNVSILEETRQAWEWFVEESQYREEQLLARDIMHWYQNRDGMARMINSQ